jgi:hypothetical protein
MPSVLDIHKSSWRFPFNDPGLPTNWDMIQPDSIVDQQADRNGPGSGVKISNCNHGGVISSKLRASAKNENTSVRDRGNHTSVRRVNSFIGSCHLFRQTPHGDCSLVDMVLRAELESHGRIFGVHVEEQVSFANSIRAGRPSIIVVWALG